MCFGHVHPVTLELRRLKDQLIQYNLGMRLVAFYYKYSSPFVAKLEKFPLIRIGISFITKPLLRLIAFLYACLRKAKQ